LTKAGAEFGPAADPMASPSAQNGIAPKTNASTSSIHTTGASRTPPNAAPSTHSRTTTVAAKTIAVNILAST
jgi:hypothetical protein